jgi:hypothetical protein
MVDLATQLRALADRVDALVPAQVVSEPVHQHEPGILRDTVTSPPEERQG